MQERSIVEYKKFSNVRVKKGFFFKKFRDPSTEVNQEIMSLIRSEGAEFNKIVSNTFNLPSEGVTKFEFYWIPERVKSTLNDSEARFRTKAKVTLIYLKESSLIYFTTEYLFIVDSGCGSSGRLMYFGGKNYELEEIYFNKITTVGAYHQEEIIQVVSQGCNAEETRYTISEDGFVIRAGENFRVVASEKYKSELSEARSLINGKIHGVNS